MGKAKDLFEAAFAPAKVRDMRSREYKEGVLAALENLENLDRIGYRMPRCPYQAGTAARDAWFAGVQEGKLLWRINSRTTH